MKLFYRTFGEGHPVIILHGLYGSSDNWVTIGKALSEKYQIWLIDQRNHGRSDHHPEYIYKAMQNDLFNFMSEHQIEKSAIIGHSMGGKTAMYFAMHHPEKISHLAVLDIAPKSYHHPSAAGDDNNEHAKIMETMLNLNFEGIKHRDELDSLLSQQIKSKKIRQFLLKNIKRKEDNSFGWKINIKTLYACLNQIIDGFSASELNLGQEINGFPVLFIKGGNSDYITEDDKESIERIFPYASYKTIKNAGHWLHTEQPKQLIEVLKNWIL